MNIELKSVKLNLTLSEDTYCFSADLYVDGVKTAYCSNRGHGGNTNIVACDNKKELLIKTESYFKNQQKIKSDFSDYTFDNSLERMVDIMIDDFVQEKENAKFKKKLIRDMSKGICYGTEKEYGCVSWKKITIEQMLKFPNGVQAIKKQIDKLLSEGKNILNTNLPENILPKKTRKVIN